MYLVGIPEGKKLKLMELPDGSPAEFETLGKALKGVRAVNGDGTGTILFLKKITMTTEKK